MSKKTLFMALTALLLAGTGCSKDDPTYNDGIYDPGRKIAQVYTQTCYVDDEPDEEYLDQQWIWIGDRLSSVMNMEGEEVQFSLTYNGNRIITMGNEGNYYRFSYNGNALTTIDMYLNGILYGSFSVTSREGDHITGMKMTGPTSIELNSAREASANAQNLVSSPLAQWLPRGLPEAIDQVIGQAQTGPAMTAKMILSLKIAFQYKGDNVSKMVITTDYYTETHNYTYDNKQNPYRGLWFAADLSPAMFSRNNILTDAVKRVYVDYGGEPYDPEEYSYTYEYEYDCLWPVKSTETNVEEGRITIHRYVYF